MDPTQTFMYPAVLFMVGHLHVLFNALASAVKIIGLHESLAGTSLCPASLREHTRFEEEISSVLLARPNSNGSFSAQLKSYKA